MEGNDSNQSGVDRSQFYDLFKEIKNEIKDKVITKFLYTIEQQAKELNELKKENKLLKNQLTYVLKKVLLNKNDYSSAAKNTRINNLNSSINYNRSMILKDNNRKSSSMLRSLRSCENYRCVTDNISSRYKEGNNSAINIHGNDNHNNVDMKVSGYLNSLYRHNFNNTNKEGGNLFLNKNQGLIEELFPNKNNSLYITRDNEIDRTFDRRRDNNVTERRSSLKKKGKNNINYGTKNASSGKRIKYKNVNTNNNTSMLKRNKDGNNYIDNNEKNKYNTYNNVARAQKKKIKKPIIYSKRSPFIANKF